METSLDTAILADAPAAAGNGNSAPLTVANMFFAPIDTLAMLRDRASFFLPLLLAATYSAAVNFWIVQRIGLRNILEKVVQASATVDADTMLRSMLGHRTEILWSQAISTFVGTFIAAFAVSLFLWLIVLIVGGDTTFKKVTAVVAHVQMLAITVKYTLLAFVVMLSANPAGLNVKNPLATNIAFFFHGGSPFAQHVLRSFDLITLTTVVLMIAGVRLVSDRLSRSAAALVVLAPWTVYVIAGGFLTSLA